MSEERLRTGVVGVERVQLSERIVPSEKGLAKRVCFSDPQVLVFVLTFSPGQTLKPHRHPGSTLVLQALSGSGLVTVDGQESPLATGDLLLVSGDGEFGATNTGGGPLALLVSLSPNPTNKLYAQEVG